MELLRHDLLHHRPHLRGHQLVFRLRGKFRLRDLDGEHGGEAFLHVVAGRLDLRLLRELVGLDVLVEGPRHRRAQPGEMRAAVPLRNVVGEALDVLLVRVVPLHRDLNRDAVLLPHRIKDVGMKHALGAIDVLDEAFHSAREREHFLLRAALVDQDDLHAAVEERELAESLRQNLIVELDLAENPGAREEVDLRAPALALADGLKRRNRLTQAKFHLMKQAIATYGQPQPLRERVDHRNANPVKAACHLVRVIVEFSASVKLRHHDLSAGSALLVIRLRFGRDAAAIVDHADRVVRMNGNRDLVAVAGKRLVYRVIDYFEHHVV